MNETDFIQSLIDASICGGAIYAVEAPASQAYPYCIYSVIRSKLTDDTEGSKGQRDRYSFTSWHETYQDAKDTLDLFESTILAGRYGRSASGGFIDKDPTTDKWRLTNNDWEVIDT